MTAPQTSGPSEANEIMRASRVRATRKINGQLVLMTISVTVALACAGHSDRGTLAALQSQEPDLSEAMVDDGIDQAMAGYRKFLAEAPKSSLTPEAMRRLADLKLEKEYGALEPVSGTDTGDSAISLPGPKWIGPTTESTTSQARKSMARQAVEGESPAAFEARVAGTTGTANATNYAAGVNHLTLPLGDSTAANGPLEAIELYDQILEVYPNYAQTDQVLYQKARAFDEVGRVDEAIKVTQELINRFPDSRHIDEAHFRRAEYFFTRKKYFTAEESYAAIAERGLISDYYELALYKLGWSFYKQMMLEEALDSYVELLDYKVATGYDFDQSGDETEEQRIADTYRVVSLCFSDLGGAEAITNFFETKGNRSYEDRVYRHLGEFYLEKRRYNDAASAYEAFTDLNPAHKLSPHFSMRVVEIYEAGSFPKLVLASKKKFAASYGLTSAYWQHESAAGSPEVLDYLKGNLEDLANHYHALYQNTDRPEDKPAHFTESALWYRTFLTSFPAEVETPGIHYQLADLLLQNEDFSSAANEYEHIAYDYPAHDRAAAAGYAAIFSHRQYEKQVTEPDLESARRESVASTIRFVDGFPLHEHSPAVLGAAVDDLYGLNDFAGAIAVGHRLLEQFPTAAEEIRRGAWTAIAHSSLDTNDFIVAENAYAQVIKLTPPEDPSAEKIMNNLAAAIYKQGEEANSVEDYRTAADHFLRIATTAPGSEIRPIAQYDAASALIHLSNWSEAASVLESFRDSYPEHELSAEATRQVAFVYREDGNLARSAEEYVRVADEAKELELRREALLVAAELYEEAELITEALATFDTYVTQFTKPIEPAVVARFKMAELFYEAGNEISRRSELEKIVAIDRSAGDERTDSVRLYAARSALMLSEETYAIFSKIELTLPFEKSLERKKKRMDIALTTFAGLIDYEVGDITAAATFYMAQVYGEFSRALLDSERPTDLDAAELDSYEMILEEEAFPFEEKSIEVHEKNLELMSAGVFNSWIEKSIAELAVVMPGRYAKFDARPGLLNSITTYTYRTPHTDIPAKPTTSPDHALELVSGDTDSETQDATVPADDVDRIQKAIVQKPAATDALPASPATFHQGAN